MLLLPRPSAVPHYHGGENNMAEETKEAASSKSATKKGPKKKSVPKKTAGAKKSTAKRKVAAGTNGNGKKANMTAFILQFPESVKPQEIAEKAKAQGLKLDPSYASTVRSKAKSAGTWPSSSSTKSTPTNGPSTADAEFYRALKKVGLSRARVLIANIEAYENA